MMSTERNWLQITEYVSLAASAVGTVAAAVSGQVAMAAAPLTVALSLNLVNRQRLQQQTQQDTSSAIAQLDRIVESLQQQVQALPDQTLSPITHSLSGLESLTQTLANRQEELAQELQVGSQTQAIEQLQTALAFLREQLIGLGLRIDNLPIPEPVNLSGVEGEIANLHDRLDVLVEEFSSRPEVPGLAKMQQDTTSSITQLHHIFESLHQQVEALPEQTLSTINQSISRVENLTQALADRQEELAQEFQTRPETEAIAQLTEQLSALALYLNNFPALEGEVSNLREQLDNLSGQFSSRSEATALPQVQQESNSAIAQFHQIQAEISSVRGQIDTLTQQFTSRPEATVLPLVQLESNNAIAQLHQQLEREINNLRLQLNNLAERLSAKLEVEALAEIKQDTNSAIAQIHQIQAEISSLRGQIDALTQQFTSRPELEVLPQMEQQTTSAIGYVRQLQEEIASVRRQLNKLTQQFNSRSEVEALPQLQHDASNAIAQLHQQLHGEINNLHIQLNDLTEQLSAKPGGGTLAEIQLETNSAIAQLDAQLQGEVTSLRSQLDDLAEQLNGKLEGAALAEIQLDTNSAIAQLHEQLQGEVTSLRSQLSDLDREFSSRPEVAAIATLSEALTTLQPPKLENWPRIKIKVISVGGGAQKAVNRALASRISNVEFWSINTDSQELTQSYSPNRLQIGESLTKGLSAGGDPAIGQKAAEESRQEIEAAVEQTDLVFILAGMGGGTGTGATPIVAQIAKEMGALTIVIVTRPFIHEGRNRAKLADVGIAALQNKVDMLIVLPIDNVFSMISEWTPIQEAFRVVDDLVCQGVQGVANIINNPGLVNVDLADLKKVIASAGLGVIGTGVGTGKSRAKSAAMAAISSPLMEVPIKGAKSVIFYITGSSDISVQEINAAAETINQAVDANTNITFGAGIDDRLQDEVRITAIATGLPVPSSR